MQLLFYNLPINFKVKVLAALANTPEGLCGKYLFSLKTWKSIINKSLVITHWAERENCLIIESDWI